MDFIDLKSQYQRLKKDIDAGIQRVLDHGQYILGPEVAELEEKLADVEAAHAPLLGIAIKSAQNMATALNGTSLLSEGMAAVQVLAEHQRITELFQKKFPIGGVAAVSSEESTPAKTQIDPRHQARVNAVRFHK